MLDDCSVCHCKRSEHESHGDTSDGSKGNANLSEKRIEQTITNRYEDNDRERIDVLHDVIGDTM